MSDDDICGHPTADGSPCQNTPTDGDSCWLDSHGGSASPSGRDFSIDESDHDDILQAARDGMSKRGCARAAGVSHTELQRYLDHHEQFRSTFIRARHTGEQKLVRGPLIDDPDDPVDIDGQHARFLLSTSFDYKKTEKQEVEHSGGIDTEVDIGDDSREAIREALASRYE